MTILLSAGSDQSNQQWHSELIKHSDRPIAVYPDIINSETIEYALVWQHPRGDLHNYPNLRAIFSLGAGVEHITSDPQLPRLPIVRLADPNMANAMADYCLYWTLAFQRRFPSYARQQRQKCWHSHSYQDNDQFRTGLLGLGQTGGLIAQKLAAMNYSVSGWSASMKSLEGITCHAGSEQRDAFLKSVDLLIVCLPHTRDTQGMIDSDFLAAMNPGSYLINIGRGALIDQTALLDSLNSGHIQEAVLDVFDTEPLPSDSPLWSQSNLHITPHVAGLTIPSSAAPIVLTNIERIEQGQQPSPLYDPIKDY